MNAYHVLGGLFAIWAITLTALGLTRDGFPRAGAQTLAVGALSVVLALGTISAAIITGALEEEEEEGNGEAAAAEPSGGGGGGRALSLSADPGGDLSFDTQTLETSAGKVTIEMKNPSSVPHNVSIEGDGVDEEGETVDQGGTSTVSAELRPGEYDFYCSVPGHRPAGMEGTLTVK